MRVVRPKITWSPPEVPHHHQGACGCEPTIAYIRVSRVGQRQVLVSPDTQLDAIRLNAKTKSKRIVKVVSDIDKSGREFTKRRVPEVIEDIKNGVAASVTVYRWSRWGRDLEYSLHYIGLVKEAGGRVDSAAEDIPQDNAAARFNRDTIMRVDQMFSEQIGEGWQAVHQRRRDDGLPHSGRDRFGYVYINTAAILERDLKDEDSPHRGWSDCEKCRDKVAHFLPHPAEGPALAHLYTEYNKGATAKALVRYLNDRGFRTPFDNLWTSQALMQMLDTGFGAGLIRERSPKLLEKFKVQRDKNGTSVRNNLRTFDVWRAGAQPALITEAEWKTYVARRLAQSELPTRLRKPAHALSGMMFCKLCARRMTARYGGRARTLGWECSWKNTFHPGVHVSMSNSNALAISRQWVLSHAGQPDEPVDVTALREFSAGEGIAARSASTVQAEIEQDVKAHSKLVIMNARSMIDDEQFAVAKAEIEKNLNRLRHELALLEVVTERPDYEAFASLAETWDRVLADVPGDLNPALRELIAFVIVEPAHGRGRWPDPAQRVEVVGAWEAGSKQGWLDGLRFRSAA